MATRKEIFDQMEAELGRVPSWMMALPESMLESEWNAFKMLELEETNIPQMYKHLIGLASAATIGNKHMAIWHGMMASAFGATDTHMDEALLVAKETSGWGAYIEGSLMDIEGFNKETTEIGKFIKDRRQQQAA